MKALIVKKSCAKNEGPQKNEENLSFGKSRFFEGTSAKFKVLFFQMIYIRMAL